VERAVLAGLALVGLLGAARASAAVEPAPLEVALAVGTTVGVNGNPGGGGASGSLAFLWPFEQRFAFGVVLFADDFGTDFVDLKDPNTGQPLGTVASLHRMGYGAGWRGEARILHSEERRWRFLWGADFAYARQERDQRGLTDNAVSGVLVATGPKFVWRTVGGHSFGGALAWKHAFMSLDADPDRATDWAQLAFVWRWQRIPKD
jgi:hypothetical protein